MTVVLVHRYFYPDVPPYASMLRTIAEQLHRDGHDVTVVTSQPSYRGYTGPRQPAKEDLDGVKIVRVQLLREKPDSTFRRLLNLGLFSVRASWKILRTRDCRVVMAATTPPILVALCALLAARARHAKFIYHMQDIYPEVAVVNPNTAVRLAPVLRALDSFTTSRADVVIVLSGDMARSVSARRRRPRLVRVINNFAPVDYSPNEPPEVARLPTGFNLVFAGNFGRFQGLTTVVRAMAELGESSKANLVFIGQGTAGPELEGAAGATLGNRVHFLPRVSQASLQTLLADADIGLVSLNAGVINFAFPSKFFSYLAAGIPVLAQVESDSELAREILRNEIGMTVPPGSPPAEIARVIARLEAANDGLRSGSAAYGVMESAPSTRLQDWSELFCELTK